MTALRLVTAIEDPPEETVRPSARVAAVADRLNCDPSHVRKLLKAGDLEGHRLGKCGIRVYLDSVAAYQRRQNIKAAPKAGEKAGQASAAPPPVSRATRAAHRQAVGSLQALGLAPASGR